MSELLPGQQSKRSRIFFLRKKTLKSFLSERSNSSYERRYSDLSYERRRSNSSYERRGKIDEGSHQPRVSKHEAEEDGNYYLSRETFFDLTMSKSHLSPHFLVNVPLSITKLLPGKTLPVVLRRGGKDWNMSYLGERKRPTFDFKWRTFAEGNNLKLGDACIFELMENGTNLLFKVHILRHELPPELVQQIAAYGKTAETAICIDDD